jgi:hypothetical protein
MFLNVFNVLILKINLKNKKYFKNNHDERNTIAHQNHTQAISSSDPSHNS